MRYVFLFLILSMAWAADPPEVKLPPDVQKIVDAREAEVAKAKAVYDAAVAKATVAASKTLEAAVKAKTQKGDLEGALAGKAVLDKWNGEAGDLLGEKAENAVKDFLGTYQISTTRWSGAWTLGKENICSSSSRGITGVWSVDKKVVTLKWNNGLVETLTFTDKGITCTLTGGITGKAEKSDAR